MPAYPRSGDSHILLLLLFFQSAPLLACCRRHDANDYGSRVVLSNTVSNLRHLSALNLFKANIGVGLGHLIKGGLTSLGFACFVLCAEGPWHAFVSCVSVFFSINSITLPP